MKREVYKTLSAVNINKHVEQKNKMSYLPWAWAWGTLLSHYPESFYTIYEYEGLNYFHDGKTAWVKTGVTVEDIELIEYLPIMNFRNQSIPCDTLTSMDVNKAIQRSLTKAVARHGLGLYLYAGEDLPEGEEKAPLKATQVAPIDYVKKLKELCKKEGISFADTAKWAKKVKSKSITTQDNAKALVNNWSKLSEDINTWVKDYHKNPSPHDLKGDYLPEEEK